MDLPFQDDRRDQLTSSSFEGGAAEGAEPHSLLGFGPITNSIVAPFIKSSCVNHVRFKGCPFNRADCIYLFTLEQFSAFRVNLFPFSSVIATSSNSGLPSVYTGIPGVTG